MSQLRLHLLGAPRIEIDGMPLVVERRKATALLVYLALTRQFHQRDTLATLFWPDQSQKLARGNLRRTLSGLNQALQGEWLEFDQENVALKQHESLWVDALYFQHLLERRQRHDHAQNKVCSTCLPLLAEAVTLYRGDFLTGFTLQDSPEFDDWQLFQTEKLHQELAEALAQLTQGYAGQGEFKTALAYAQRWLSLDPLHEPAHRSLMQLYIESGDRAAALRQYQECTQLLQAELGLTPSPETIQLYKAIKSTQRDKGAEGQGYPQDYSSPAKSESGGETLSPAPWLRSADDGRSVSSRASAHDWGEVPDIGAFYGRQAELAVLEQWLVTDRCRLVAILGMGGVGKTALAAKVTQASAVGFEYVIWRSLLNAPPFEEVMRGCLQFLSAQQITNLPHSLDDQLALLLDQLRRQRCLIVLDNLEAILQGGEQAGYYRPGYEAYGQLIQRVGESKHQSCLLLTSRERPKGFRRLEGDTALVRSLQLVGLDIEAGQEILKARGLTSSAETKAALIERYSGNPLALRLMAETIHELFEDDIAAFLTEETPIFDDIRDVLDQQFARLSTLEQELLTWLAIEREAIGPEQLQANLVQAPSRRELLERLRALRRRSLLERGATGFTLQNVVMEYVTDRLVETVSQEIVDREVTGHLNRYALLKAQVKEYVRSSQTRLIVQHIIERLQSYYGLEGCEVQLKEMVVRLRQAQSKQTAEVSETSAVSVPKPGYAGGNLLNLLLHLKSEVKGINFSGLAIWQAYLQGMRLREVNFSRTDLAGSVFTESFGVVPSVRFSPDGRLLAAGTSDGRVWVWRTGDGRLLLTYQGHTDWIYSVCFSPDGQRLASGSGDQTIRLWEVETGQCLNILQGHTNWVRSVCFSPDGLLLASGSGDQTIRLWEVETGQCLNLLQGHTGNIWSVCFNPDGQSLASGSFDGTIRLWDIQTGQCFKILEGNPVEIISFSPDGQSLASNDGRTIRLWDVNTGRCLKILQGHTDRVWSVCFSPDGLSIASGSPDQTIRLWDIDTGQCLKTLEGHTSAVRSICFSLDGQSLASGSHDGTTRLWDVSTGQCLRILQGHTNFISSVCFSPDGQSLVSGGTDQTIRLWKVGTGQHLKTLQGYRGWVSSVCFSPDGHSLASGSEDLTIRLWAVQSGQAFKTLRGHTRLVTRVCFSPDGETLASSSDDKTIRLWDVRTGHCLKILQGHIDEVASVCFSPDGQHLASGGTDQTIRLWEVGTGQCLSVLRGHTMKVRSVCFSPDGQSLASGSRDWTIRLWDVHTGQCLKILRGHTDEVSPVHFNPDGQSLVSGSRDRTIRLWDMGTGHCFQTLQGHTAPLNSVQFSPDGQILASGSDDETIRFWEVKSGVCLKVLRPDRPYERLNITDASGLSEAQRATLKALGAVEE